VEADPADQLDVVVALAEGPLAGLAHEGVGRDEDVVERLLLDLLELLVDELGLLRPAVEAELLGLVEELHGVLRVEGLLDLVPEGLGPGLQLRVGEPGVLALEGVDRVDDREDLPDQALVPPAEEPRPPGRDGARHLVERVVDLVECFEETHV